MTSTPAARPRRNPPVEISRRAATRSDGSKSRSALTAGSRPSRRAAAEWRSAASMASPSESNFSRSTFGPRRIVSL
jgi:hypothetical protein